MAYLKGVDARELALDKASRRVTISNIPPEAMEKVIELVRENGGNIIKS